MIYWTWGQGLEIGLDNSNLSVGIKLLFLTMISSV